MEHQIILGNNEETIAEYINGNYDKFVEAMKSLHPKEYCEVFLELIKIVINMD